MSDLCFQDGQKVLFIGDSITDCGRRDVAAPLGDGYVSLLHDLVVASWPERSLAWVNKGIGGNKITDLHTYLGDQQNGVSPARFREGYHEVLTWATTKITPQLLLITPFYISRDRAGHSWRSLVLNLLPEYIGVVEEMATEFGARLVRLQPMFERQVDYRPAETFCPEPVHPNRTGHLLIAREVLRVLSEA